MPLSDATAAHHRLLVEADADTNALLRLLEPFVIHDVLPGRIQCASAGDTLTVSLDFAADADVARRLHARLSAMVVVRRATLALADAPAGAGRTATSAAA